RRHPPQSPPRHLPHLARRQDHFPAQLRLLRALLSLAPRAPARSKATRTQPMPQRRVAVSPAPATARRPCPNAGGSDAPTLGRRLTSPGATRFSNASDGRRHAGRPAASFDSRAGASSHRAAARSLRPRAGGGGRGSGADAVAAGALGLVELFVGAGDEGGGGVVGLDGGAAEADGDADGFALEDEAVLGDLFAEGLREGDGAFELGLREHDRELFAAVAGEDFVAADALLDDLGELAQDVVAREVAALVVDALEEVDVEHDEAEGAGVAARPDELALEGLEQVALVVDLGETIDDGHPVDFFVVLGLGVCAG